MSEPLEYTPENERLVAAVVGPTRADHKTTIMIDTFARRINGRYIVGNVPVLDAHGKIIVNRAAGVLVTRRQRFRIPKGHPWRGKRP